LDAIDPHADDIAGEPPANHQILYEDDIPSRIEGVIEGRQRIGNRDREREGEVVDAVKVDLGTYENYYISVVNDEIPQVGQTGVIAAVVLLERTVQTIAIDSEVRVIRYQKPALPSVIRRGGGNVVIVSAYPPGAIAHPDFPNDLGRRSFLAEAGRQGGDEEDQGVEKKLYRFFGLLGVRPGRLDALLIR
jgi:hypothetical protein